VVITGAVCVLTFETLTQSRSAIAAVAVLVGLVAARTTVARDVT
jgi:hypothetical protein